MPFIDKVASHFVTLEFGALYTLEFGALYRHTCFAFLCLGVRCLLQQHTCFAYFTLEFGALHTHLLRTFSLWSSVPSTHICSTHFCFGVLRCFTLFHFETRSPLHTHTSVPSTHIFEGAAGPQRSRTACKGARVAGS